MQSAAELQKALVKDVPAKIDIGPVYTVDPRRRKAYAGKHFGLLRILTPDSDRSHCCTLYLSSLLMVFKTGG